ncbi:MAG: hypothetical protein EOP56_17445 [Sphingobacteriales bacterium]|nr:MAG: hypothetical protein EOP56_17445 [Sphingobacteriales bacterium]
MFSKTFASLILASLLSVGKAGAQDFSEIKVIEDSLVLTADSMYNGFLPEMRVIYNEQFVRQLIRALKQPNSYSYDFPKLKEKINIIGPDDKSFRMFNWGIAPTEVTRRYYGAIQMPGEQLKLYPLMDHSDKIKKGAEDSVLTNGRWFGAIYYRIMPQEVNGQTVYTMFGLNAGNALSTKKLMDPMVITAKGPVFGAPIFNVTSQGNPSQRINRFVMEYKKNVQASLNWDKELNAVYLDKLVSDVNDPNRKYTYVPSGQMDGFRWNNGYWNYVEDLVPVDPLTDGAAPAPVPVKTAKE